MMHSENGFGMTNRSQLFRRQQCEYLKCINRTGQPDIRDNSMIPGLMDWCGPFGPSGVIMREIPDRS